MSEQNIIVPENKQLRVVQADSERNVQTEIDLVELFYRLLNAWKLIALFALIGAFAAYGLTKFYITPKYQSKAVIYAVGRSDSVINMSDLQIGSSLTNDYISIFNIWEVHARVIETLEERGHDMRGYSYSSLHNMLEVKNPSSTRMINITVTGTNPQLCADIANAYAEVVSDYIAETMSTDRPNIMSTARVSTNPVSPSVKRNCVLGFLVGAVLACCIVVLRMLLDDKIKTSEDILKYTGLVNLAVVPRDDVQLSANAYYTKRKEK